MPNFNLSTVEGVSSGIPIGSLHTFPLSSDVDFTVLGQRWLRSGFIETDTSKFDTSLFGFSKYTLANRDSFWAVGSQLTNKTYAGTYSQPGTQTIVSLWNSNGTGSCLCIYSVNNGVTWSTPISLPGPTGLGLIGCVWVGDGFVIMTDNGNVIKGNTNAWSNIGNVGVQTNAFNWNGSMFIAGSNTGTTYRSTNGVTWTLNNQVLVNPVTGVAYGNGRWVVVCSLISNGTGVAYSTDGVTWFNGNAVTGGSASVILNDVIFDGTYFVSYCRVGSFEGIWRSTNGSLWTRDSTHTYVTQFDSHSNRGARRLTYKDGTYAVGGLNGTYWISSDGLKWKQQTGTQGVIDATLTFPSFLDDGRLVMGTASVGIHNIITANTYLYAGCPYTVYSNSDKVKTGESTVSYMRIS